MKNLFSINLLLNVTLLSSLLIFMGCAINPVSGKKQVSLMSEKQEIALGAESELWLISIMKLSLPVSWDMK